MGCISAKRRKQISQKTNNMFSVRCASRNVEPLFICGYTAALMSEMNELESVAVHPQASALRDINAWVAGAKAINPKMG